MSWAEEEGFDAYDLEAYYEMREEEVAKAQASRIWTTKEGRKVSITRMGTAHLENTIRYLERTGDPYEWLPIFEAEMHRRMMRCLG